MTKYTATIEFESEDQYKDLKRRLTLTLLYAQNIDVTYLNVTEEIAEIKTETGYGKVRWTESDPIELLGDRDPDWEKEND